MISAATPAARQEFFRRTAHDIRPGLGVVVPLLERLGRPDRAGVALHVAGTNGKGSVCALLESMLRAAGFRTGLYTSPHLVTFNERIRVDGQPIPDADLDRLLARVEAEAGALEKETGGRAATFFELTTALAHLYFREKEVQVAVLETGMGGRWDATNTIIPAVAVITEIDLDHMEYLGPTIRDIAGEKAGIIKPGRPVVSGATHPDARAVIAAAAAEQHAPLIFAEEAAQVTRQAVDWCGQRVKIETAAQSYRPVMLPLLGTHQLRNAAMAVAAFERFAELAGGRDGPDWTDAVRRGIETVRWPARLQVLRRTPPILLDGAHNPHGARALRTAIRELKHRGPVGWIGGMLADKDVAGFVREIASAADCAWAVPVDNARALPPDELAGLISAAGVPVSRATLPEAWRDAVFWADANDGLVVIAGSLYLAGETLALTGTPLW